MTDPCLVYVRLPDELVDVWVPVEAELVAAGVYRLGSKGYDAELERWEFPPSSIVSCKKMKFEDGMTFLGPGYKDCGGGRFVSADGVRQFRMTDNDILGVDSPCGPHVHFEELNPGRANSNFHRQIK